MINMGENKINRTINTKSLLIFFVVFIISYCLFNYVYVEILRLKFSDLFKLASNQDYWNISRDRLYELERWQFLKPFILSIILSLTCVYIKIFKKNYFKESIIAILIFIAALFLFVFLSQFYTYKQRKDNETIYKKLIVGKWHYTNRSIGNVIVIFDTDSTGHRFNDSIKTIQKFGYKIKRNLLSFNLESYTSEFYWIDSLTTKTLILKRVFKNKMKHSVYESKFTRGSP